MEEITNLAQLLLYHVAGLFSAEQQISIAMIRFIEEAHHKSLRNALKHHASLTSAQVERLSQIAGLVMDKLEKVENKIKNSLDEKLVNKGMKGLLEEIDELLCKTLAVEVKDAAIIAAVQKIEHYEICAYGTALAFAKQLDLPSVASLLTETLEEEYDADDLLTSLAIAAINNEGIPEGLEKEKRQVDENNRLLIPGDPQDDHAKVTISERTIHSPGGRAGTSHRRYPNGESRGH